jgi:hypothetical protein
MELTNIDFENNILSFDITSNIDLQVLLINTSNLNQIQGLPPNIIKVNIENSQLEKIDFYDVPNSIQYIGISYNNIEHIFNLSIMINLVELDLSNNTLLELTELPPNLIKLNCSNNLLSKIVFVDSLQYILLNDNCLSKIPTIPMNCIEINLTNNELTMTPHSESPTTNIIIDQILSNTNNNNNNYNQFNQINSYEDSIDSDSDSDIIIINEDSNDDIMMNFGQYNTTPSYIPEYTEVKYRRSYII